MLLVYSIKNVGISYDYQKTLLHHIILLSIAFKLDQQCTLLDHPVPKNRPMIAN